MGCDIHGVWQRKVGDAWEDVSSEYEQGRDYRLFAVLAGVRAGECAPRPIAEPRGLPDDFEAIDECHPVASIEVMDPRRRRWHDKDEPLEINMGDHSHSWLTSTEMLAARDRFSRVYMTGIVDRKTYESWDRESTPRMYSGGVGGASVVMYDGMNDNEAIGRIFGTPQWTYRSVNWFENHSEGLAYFFDEVQRLHDLHGEVRFVFGFDS